MQISKDSVVQFNYRIKDTDGTQLESNENSDPAAYLHGHNNMMPGVEKAMEGKSKGDSFSVTLEPEDAFGEVQPDAEMRISVKHLLGADKWKAGMRAVVRTEHGPTEVTVLKVGKFMATVDTNHPHAGKTLVFDLDVVDVREATKEEIDHGHAHGVGGHHH